MKPIKLLSSILLTIGAALMISIAFGYSFPIVLLVVFLISLVPQGMDNVFRTVVSNPLIGRAKQSMGGVTFSTWKGINVLKNKATTVANPQTGGQLAQRSAFSQMVALFRQMPAAIRVGFKKQAVKKSEFNAFASANLNEAWDMSAPPVATFVPVDLITAKGTIAQTIIATAVIDKSSGTITATWVTGTLQPGQSSADIPVICAYNETKNLATGGIGTTTRTDATGDISLPEEWDIADVCWVYLAFYNSLTGESSDSNNLTATIVA